MVSGVPRAARARFTGSANSWLWAYFVFCCVTVRLPLCQDLPFPMAQPNPPLAHPMPILQGQPLPLIVDHRRHLEIITSSDGIAQRFRDKVPSKLEAISHWIKSVRASMKRTKAGVHWLDQVVVVQGQPAQTISHTVPMTVVFDFPVKTEVLVNVRLQNGNTVRIAPPADVLDLISSQVYNFVLPLISREDRKLYDGVPEDDGWALLARIKSTEAELGSYLEMLENKRDNLSCTSLRDYPSFRAAVLQLKLDWQSAIDGSLIDVDEDWPMSKVKQLIADRLSPLFGESIGEWVSDVSNRTRTIEQTFEKADAIYKNKMRMLKNKRKFASAQLVHVADAKEEDSDAEALQMYPATTHDRDPRRRAPVRQRQSRREDQPPSWLAPMMTAMAATIAQAITSAQHAPAYSPGGARAPRNRAAGGRGGRLGRGKGFHGRGRGGSYQYVADQSEFGHADDVEEAGQFLADFDHEQQQ